MRDQSDDPPHHKWMLYHRSTSCSLIYRTFLSSRFQNNQKYYDNYVYKLIHFHYLFFYLLGCHSVSNVHDCLFYEILMNFLYWTINHKQVDTQAYKIIIFSRYIMNQMYGYKHKPNGPSDRDQSQIIDQPHTQARYH